MAYLLGFLAWQAKAQDSLERIVIRAYPYEKYAVGAKIWQADSVLLSQNTLPISQWLSAYTPAYLKEYGNGLFGSIALRGTGAGHTAILWNGLNINSATLGEGDFANIPTFANASVALQMGNAASLYGSEAIGGALLLSSFEPSELDTQISFKQEIGSFGRNFWGAEVQKNTQKIAFKTNVYTFNLKNNYEIPSLTGNTQNNTPINYLGISQDAIWQINNKHTISLHHWYNSNHRTLENGATLLDNNLRLMLDWEHTFHSSNRITAKFAYTNDFLRYNLDDTTQTRRLAMILNYEKQLKNNFSVRLGSQTQYFLMNVDAYQEKKTELRNEFFMFSQWQATYRLALHLNLRQGLVSGYTAPFTPALGLVYSLQKTENQLLKWKLQISRAYRLPTLNSRYWQPGGNPNIQAENSLSTETGIIWEKKNQKSKLQAEATFFVMQVEDWILWQPTEGGVWSPENLQNVFSKGAELSVIYQLKIKDLLLNSFLHYTFSESFITTIKNDQTGRFEGKILPYSPKNRASFTLFANYRQHSLSWNTHFTDTRFSDLANQNKLKSFIISNLSLSRSFKLQSHKLSINLNINNLMNKTYENIQNQYMPKRNYQLSIQYIFNK
ncbi:MAG: TonB-dependent receptor [Thermonemataceae bacterium]|nr:TonB-dependent receptor [Thermonemataceae bacterium]